MLTALLGTFVLIIHLLFILFVVLGGILVFRYAWVAWIHLPAVVWAVLLELAGWTCPLTPIEQWLKVQSGQSAFPLEVIDYYLLQLIYPPGLTPDIQFFLGLIVFALNCIIYAFFIHRIREKRNQMDEG